jgi:hypothetical protein
MPASQHADRPDEATNSVAADSRLEDALAELWPQLRQSASKMGAFRFAPEELEELHDVVYEVLKGDRVTIEKQEVARLALAALLLEWRREGARSLLGRYVERRKATTG